MVGNCLAKSTTRVRKAASSGKRCLKSPDSGETLSRALKSASFFPPKRESACNFCVSLIASSKKAATVSKSLVSAPRDVKAGVPRRIPEGTSADLSEGTVFLLAIKLNNVCPDEQS